MSGKSTRRAAASQERVPNGHGYCWAEHPQTHVRCCEPKGHPPRPGSGGHVYPYTPRTEW